MANVLVVKLGGSSAASPDLKRWVHVFEAGGRPVVLVPGGGPFADTVRRCQSAIGYDDPAAHAMAILAMEQFGHALIGIGTRFAAARDLGEITALLETGQVPVWMASRLVLEDKLVEKNWNVTSDSLAAWLAARIPGARLLLIKQIDMPEGCTVEAMSGASIVDAAFSSMYDPQIPLSVAGPADLSTAEALLRAGKIPGRAVPPGPSHRFGP